jgi:ribosome biogenesis GTPase / thiamine phosphate phosphatase
METMQSRQPARISSVEKDSFLTLIGNKEIFAQIDGKLRFSIQSPLDWPATGDWVNVSLHNDGELALIHEVLPRKSLLSRKKAGHEIEYQLIAANIDAAFIIQSLDHNFNLRRLERNLTLVHEAGITPLVLLSKSDLLSSDDIQNHIEQIRNANGELAIAAFSNLSGEGIDSIRAMIEPGKTYCLMGSSGVGKTTLLNTLIGREIYPTAPVREHDSHGRHTTTRRQLITLESGGIMIDTPGMRELAGIDIEAGLEMTFEEIAALSLQCKFTDCSHANEPGCAIRSAIESGTLSQDRLDNYQKMQKESRFNEMSYAQKRGRDKAFGKLVKNVIKNHRKYR